MDELKSFYYYLKNPTIRLIKETDFSSSLSKCLQLFVIIFALEIIFIFPLLAAVGVDDMPHAFEMLKETNTGWMIAILAIIVAPIFEECIFRFPLKSPTLLSLIFLGFLAFSSFLFASNLFQEYTWEIAALIFAILLLFIFIKILKKQRLKALIFSYYPIFFYLVAVLFAFVHIFNFSVDHIAWWKAPVLVLPQFLLALLLGYIRIRFGLLFSIIIHALNNAIPISMLYLFKMI